MTITLSLEQLADHLRLDREAVDVGDPRRTILVELWQAGADRIELYAPDAPKDTKNLALACFAGYKYDSPPTFAGDVFRLSGAQGLLAPWRVPVFATVGGTTAPSAATGDTTGETDLEPSEPETAPATRYLAVKATNDFDADDYLHGVEFTGDQVTVPVFPDGVLRAYIGVAIEAGKVITRIAFDPDGSNQIVTSQWSRESQIVIAGQPYTPWDSNGVYFSSVAGFDLKFEIEDE